MMPSGLEGATGSGIGLRCFARKVGKRYVAECIDLDLAAESDTLIGAIDGLRDAVMGYLMVIFEGIETDQEVRASDILRPAPLSHFVRYYLEYCMHRALDLFSFGLRSESDEKFYYCAPNRLGEHCRA